MEGRPIAAAPLFFGVYADVVCASGLVKLGLVASIPDGALKPPCCGAGSSQKAGFHLNFAPENRSQKLSRGLG